MDRVRSIQEARLSALERENVRLRADVEWLIESMRDLRRTAQLAAEDTYNLGIATQRARSAFRFFEEREAKLIERLRRDPDELPARPKIATIAAARKARLRSKPRR
jgi:hypothetical protein